MAGTREARLIAAAVGRKVSMVAGRVPRRWRRLTADRADYAARPPMIVTTVPKSGTHLVHQIVEVLPGTVDYGTFVATTVSYRRRKRSPAALARRVRAVAPGEIVRAHIDHHAEVVAAARDVGAFVVFVHRDPRDVALSEAHYLADMAPWHSMHRAFARRTPAERIDLAIGGLPEDPGLYPDVGRRFEQYAGWLDDAQVVLRYEDLVSDGRDAAIRQLVQAYADAADAELDTDDVTRRAIEAIDPSRSHTFRKGEPGGWRRDLTAEQKQAFDRVAAPVLARYGYPPTFTPDDVPADA